METISRRNLCLRAIWLSYFFFWTYTKKAMRFLLNKEHVISKPNSHRKRTKMHMLIEKLRSNQPPSAQHTGKQRHVSSPVPQQQAKWEAWDRKRKREPFWQNQKLSILWKTYYLFTSSSSFKFYFDTQIKKKYKLRKYLVINHISNKYEKVIVSPSLQEKEGILLNQRA